jgi:hypothetical protein
MSTQRICQLLVSFCIITIIAFLSERSRVLASIVTVVPLNITVGLWFIYTAVPGDAVAVAEFARMVLLGLIPTALFVVACRFGVRQGWPLWRVLVVGYAVWLAAMTVYRLVDSQLSHP